MISKEFIDMWEMLPETWRMEVAERSGCCPHSKRHKWGMVTDILVWTECYASMASILSQAFPDMAPHFLAHFKTVVKAVQNFEGTAWATYDMVARRQAANCSSLDWGVVDCRIQ